MGELLHRDERPATGTRTAARWQFRLRHVFIVTTCVAVAAAVARAFGLGTLAISTGLLVALLNWSGAFAASQNGRTQLLILGVAWLMFLVSLALPAVEIFGPILGAEAAWAALIMPWEGIRGRGPQGSGIVVFLAVDVANLLMVLLPLGIWRLARGRGRAFCIVLCLTMIAAWAMGWNARVLIGYYVWSASFIIALVAIPLRGWLLATMIAVAAALAALVR